MADVPAPPTLRTIVPRGRLVAIEGDGLRLTGLLAEPAEPSGTGAAVLHIHGRGGNASTRPGTTLIAGWPQDGVAHLSVNLRSRDLGYTAIPEEGDDPGQREHYDVGGGMWELLDESAADVALAVDALRGAGYPAVVLASHSAGALALARYVATNAGVAARVLLSPLTGARGSLVRWFGGEDALARAADTARAMVAEGRGRELLAVRGWYHAISAASLLDRLSFDHDAWRRALEADDSPCLLVWGSAETRAGHWSEVATGLALPDVRTAVLEGSGHYYVGQGDALVEIVRGFVADVVSSADR